MKLTMVQIRSLTRQHLCSLIEEELQGGELFMKEVWERCESPDQVEATERELREVLAFLRDREQRFGEADES